MPPTLSTSPVNTGTRTINLPKMHPYRPGVLVLAVCHYHLLGGWLLQCTGMDSCLRTFGRCVLHCFLGMDLCVTIRRESTFVDGSKGLHQLALTVHWSTGVTVKVGGIVLHCNLKVGVRLVRGAPRRRVTDDVSRMIQCRTLQLKISLWSVADHPI